MREEAVKLFKSVQLNICNELETIEHGYKFKKDPWNRIDSDGSVGGGGISNIITGKVFEKGGVNFSEVYGTAPKQLLDLGHTGSFYATGVSLVIHPYSPLVPTIHANFRYITIGEVSWFGGGIDLTPYYLNRSQAKRFHQSIKACCDQHNSEFYPKFKKTCDEYFYLPHRQEHRGIGGIFFDYLGRNQEPSEYFSFVETISNNFCNLYNPIVKENMNLPFSDEQKKFQLYRRGRYVEFNLLYDRGTKFGLETNGRTESILMSLPPVVNWDYDFQINENSEEQELINVIKNPVSWI